MTEEHNVQTLLQILRVREPGATLTMPEEVEDWQALFETANSHHVPSLFHYQCKAWGLEPLIPEGTLQKIRAAYSLHSARNLQLYHELDEVLACVAEDEIPVVVLKGPFLGTKVYASPALRSMGDLDLLMHPMDIPRAMRRLETLGYEAVIQPWVNTHGIHTVLGASDRSARLEVHWDLVIPNPHYRIPVDEVWEAVRPFTISTQSALTLCPEHLILYFCEHAALNHLFIQGLRPLVDIDRTVRRLQGELDWERVLKTSSNWGLGKALALSLCLCRRCLHTPLPLPVIESLGIPDISEEIVRNAFNQAAFGPGSSQQPPSGLFKVRAEKNRMRKWRLFFQYVLTLPRPPYQARGEWPLHLRAYYGIRRLLYLISKHSSRVWGMARNKTDASARNNQKSILLRWLQQG